MIRNDAKFVQCLFPPLRVVLSTTGNRLMACGSGITIGRTGLSHERWPKVIFSQANFFRVLRTGAGVSDVQDRKLRRRPSIKASAASTPMVAPRQRARCSTARSERGWGHGHISDSYSLRAMSLRPNVLDISVNQPGTKGAAEPGGCHSVLEGTSKNNKVCGNRRPGNGRQAVTTAS